MSHNIHEKTRGMDPSCHSISSADELSPDRNKRNIKVHTIIDYLINVNTLNVLMV